MIAQTSCGLAGAAIGQFGIGGSTQGSRRTTLCSFRGISASGFSELFVEASFRRVGVGLALPARSPATDKRGRQAVPLRKAGGFNAPPAPLTAGSIGKGNHNV